MKKLIDYLMKSVSKFTIWDYAWFKICLFSLGIIFGVYFSQFFLQYILLVWIAFALTYSWLIYKIFFKK